MDFFLQPQNSIQDLPTVLLAKICSFLGSKETMLTTPLLCKSIYMSIKMDSQFFKAMNSEYSETVQGKKDCFIVNQKLLNNLSIEGQDLFKMFRLLQMNYQRLNKDKHIQLIPVQASSQDNNQSHHRTVNRYDKNQFWSSTGSIVPEADEWLTYKIPISDANISDKLSKGLQGFAIISKFIVKVYDPSLFQYVEHKYGPKAIQIEIGNQPDKYHYQSKIYPVDQNSTEEQVFDIAPELQSGRFIKVNLLGKPHKQPMDNKYYIALSYFGIEGVSFEDLEFDQVMKLKGQEEEKDGSSIGETDDKSFNKRFQSLILNSNNKVGEEGVQIEDFNALEQLSLENNNPDFEKELAAQETDSKRFEYLFNYREQVLINIENYFSNKIVTYKDITKMFQYSLKEFGISGETTSMIVLQMLKIQNKTERAMFINQIDRTIKQEWSVMIDLPQKALTQLAKGSIWFTNQETSKILQSFRFEDEYLEFELFHNTDSEAQELQGSVRVFYQNAGAQIQRHQFFDFERPLKAMFKKHGKTNGVYEAIDTYSNYFRDIYSENYKRHAGKIKKEIDDAREAQMGGMYM